MVGRHESEVLENLTEILHIQKNAAIKGDFDVLNQSTEDQNLAYAKLAEFEIQRLKLITPIARELELRPEEVTLSLLKDKMKDSEGKRWEKISDVFKMLVEKVKRSAKLNRLIIGKCLELGEERLRMVLDFHLGQEQYNEDGKTVKSGRQSGVVVNKKM